MCKHTCISVGSVRLLQVKGNKCWVLMWFFGSSSLGQYLHTSSFSNSFSIFSYSVVPFICLVSFNLFMNLLSIISHCCLCLVVFFPFFCLTWSNFYPFVSTSVFLLFLCLHLWLFQSPFIFCVCFYIFLFENGRDWRPADMKRQSLSNTNRDSCSFVCLKAV